ncbi:hypothetical protein HanHA300_Chr01g0022191 [Helianthus annuus]|nr:hypothetical protein HanHA89_Chr08g0280561 [Helianthus annuus]KAJ0611998.1 hypothetical protein HanHA300_Chr01g0022191 [Helianthus annuus]KAJ0701427.1 hypothetical protein HanOQP8_Chr10g0379271 [Helianthus annuus]KAJ0729202.1 hypothetical protein HanLR1_Chr07g0250281 [Helianthus annuus]
MPQYMHNLQKNEDQTSYINLLSDLRKLFNNFNSHQVTDFKQSCYLNLHRHTVSNNESAKTKEKKIRHKRTNNNKTIDHKSKQQITQYMSQLEDKKPRAKLSQGPDSRFITLWCLDKPLLRSHF